MSLAINSHCLQCFLKRHIETARTLADEPRVMAFAKDLLALCLTAPEGVSSSWLGPGAETLLQKHFGVEADRYKEEKLRSNAFALERLDQIRAMAEDAEDPVYAGLQLAVLGNYLDFAALGNAVNFDKLEEMLCSARSMELDRQCYARLRQELKTGGKLLYLTDNCGEIVFDRVLAEEIAKAYPQVEITFCVRGGVAHNDATRADAEAVGIPFPIIDSGSNIGGTEIRELGQEARQALENADIVIAKGMGNTETMFGCGYNVYYAFLVKCPRFATQFGKPLMTPMLVRERG